MSFLVCQILSIIWSQIEIEIIFSLTNIFKNLKWCHLQSKNLIFKNFVSKIDQVILELIVSHLPIYYN
jgi:hypothetical protein